MSMVSSPTESTSLAWPFPEVEKTKESLAIQHKDKDKNGDLPQGLRLCVIFISLVLSILLIALDTTIIATAVPQITDEFKSLDQVGWYGSAYFLTFAAFQSVWGKAYAYFDTKVTFAVGIGIFEVGTLVCALSQSSTVFIAGRAVTGFGGAALASGTFTIVAKIATPEKRPMYTGFMGATFAIASVIGPLLGGLFTEYTQGAPYSGWRWCFWINLPLGAIASTIIALVLKPPPVENNQISLKDKILHMDLIGIVPLLGGMVCFLLPMRWGGVLLPWDSAQVIGNLEGSVICLLLFIMVEWYSGDKAMMQWRLLKQYQILLNLMYTFLLAGLYMPAVYFVSIQFQALENQSPARAGLQLIPLVLCVSLGTIISNTSISKFGRAGIWLLFGPIFGTAGALMIWKMGGTADTGSWTFFQIILGFGIGFALQTTMNINQSLVVPEDIPIIVGMTLFFEMAGAAFLIAACESAFANQLVVFLARSDSNVDSVSVVESGASQLRHLFTSDQLTDVLSAYQAGLDVAYMVMFSCGCATLLVAFCLVARPKSRRHLFKASLYDKTATCT